MSFLVRLGMVRSYTISNRMSRYCVLGKERPQSVAAVETAKLAVLVEMPIFSMAARGESGLCELRTAVRNVDNASSWRCLGG